MKADRVMLVVVVVGVIALAGCGSASLPGPQYESSAGVEEAEDSQIPVAEGRSRSIPATSMKLQEDSARGTIDEAVKLISGLQFAKAAAKLEPIVPDANGPGEAHQAAGVRPRAREFTEVQAEAAFWLAYCYEKLGQAEKAATLYARAAKVDPESRLGNRAMQQNLRLNRTVLDKRATDAEAGADAETGDATD